MMHIISNEKDSYGLLTYDHDSFVDYSLFFESTRLKGIDGSLNCQVNKKSNVQKMKQFHLIRSTGPDVVSRRLREVIELAVPSEVEFLDVRIQYNGEDIDGFSCITPLEKLPCIDMEESEYKLTNFDPANPSYTFYYTLLLPELASGAQIVRCAEQPTLIVVGEKIKAACAAAGLKGLNFCRPWTSPATTGPSASASSRRVQRIGRKAATSYFVLSAPRGIPLGSPTDRLKHTRPAATSRMACTSSASGSSFTM
jgi:hypothetical protein